MHPATLGPLGPVVVYISAEIPLPRRCVFGPLREPPCFWLHALRLRAAPLPRLLPLDGIADSQPARFAPAAVVRLAVCCVSPVVVVATPNIYPKSKRKERAIALFTILFVLGIGMC